MPDFLAEVLTWPDNYYNAIAVETAVNMGLPPTSLLTEKQPSEEWSREDKKLAMAWTLLQHETCGYCAQPLWVCRTESSNVRFRTQKGVCFAKQAQDKYAESKQGKDLKPGEYLYTTAYTQDGSPLPSRREYLESLNEDN